MSLIEKAVAHSKRMRASQNERDRPPAAQVNLNVTPAMPALGRANLQPASDGKTEECRLALSVSRHVELDSEVLTQNRIRAHLSNDAMANLFGVLATQMVSRMEAEQHRNLAIVSPTSGVGKSTLAANLAIAIARRESSSVLLVDLDLRKPSQASLFGVPVQQGIEDCLSCNLSLDAASIGFSQFPRLALLPGVSGCNNVEEVLNSMQMDRLLEEIQENPPARWVIYDLPPILGLSDVLTLMPKFDSVLLVVEEFLTSQSEIEEAMRLIDKTPLVGYVTNKGFSNPGVDYGVKNYGSDSSNAS